MSNPVTFINNYANAISKFISDLDTLQLMNAQLVADPTLVARYFSLSGPRTDIVATDITNAQAAIVQMLFTFNSGNPTNASQLFKVTP